MLRFFLHEPDLLLQAGADFVLFQVALEIVMMIARMTIGSYAGAAEDVERTRRLLLVVNANLVPLLLRLIRLRLLPVFLLEPADLFGIVLVLAKEQHVVLAHLQILLHDLRVVLLFEEDFAALQDDNLAQLVNYLKVEADLMLALESEDHLVHEVVDANPILIFVLGVLVRFHELLGMCVEVRWSPRGLDALACAHLLDDGRHAVLDFVVYVVALVEGVFARLVHFLLACELLLATRA